ncbi:MAG: thiamine pyrophosphate-dependent enzyme [Bilophila wadsworthia]
MAIRLLIRERFFPHLWCPGCGHGHVLNAMLHSVDDLGYDPSSIVMVSGIGCSARIAGYVDFHTMHTLHGRALAFATGIKLSRPDLHVIVPMGDGDAPPSGATISSTRRGAISSSPRSS